MPEQPYTFQEVEIAHVRAQRDHPAVFGKMDLRQFSETMNQKLGTDRYKLGTHGPVIRTALEVNAGLNDLVAPVAEVTGQAGKDFGGMFGQTGAEIGESLGKGLPRMAVDLGAFALAGAAAPELGLGALGTGALMGLGLLPTATGTYAETGSKGAAAISAAALPLMGAAGKYVGGKTAGYLAPKLEKFLGPNLPRVTEGLSRELGDQLGIMGVMEGSRQGQSLVTGQGLAPITARSIGEAAAGNLLFAPMSIPRLAKGHVVDTSGVKAQVRQAGFKDLGKDPLTYLRESEARTQAEGLTQQARSAAVQFAALQEAQAQAAARAVIPEAPRALDTTTPIPVTQTVTGQTTATLAAAAKVTSTDPMGTPTPVKPKAVTPVAVPVEDYTTIFETAKRGQTDLAGVRHPLLVEAFPFIEAGMITSPDGLKRWVEDGMPNLSPMLKFKADVKIQEALARYKEEGGDFSGKLPPKMGPDGKLVDSMGYYFDPIPENDLPGEVNRFKEIAALRADTAVGRAEAKANAEAEASKSAAKAEKDAKLKAAADKANAWQVRTAPVWAVMDQGARKRALNIETKATWEQLTVDQKVTVGRFVDRNQGTSAKEVKKGQTTLPLDEPVVPRTTPTTGGSIVPTGTQPPSVKVTSLESPEKPTGVKAGAPEDDWRVAVQAPQGKVPGFVQIINPRGKETDKSPTIESLRAAGHEVPDFSKLPQGKYTYKEAVEKAKVTTPEVSAQTTLPLNPNAPGTVIESPIAKKVKANPTAGVKPLPSGHVPGNTMMEKLKMMLSPEEYALLKSKGIEKLLKNKTVDPVKIQEAIDVMTGKQLELKSDAAIEKEVKKLEADGATPEELARAKKKQKETGVLPGEDAAKTAARKAGLSEVLGTDVPDGEFLLRTHRFFDNLFEMRGEVGEKKDFLVRNAMFLAARYEAVAGRTRLGKVLTGPSFFAPKTDGKFNALIGIKKSTAKGEMENLRILWDFGHELAHGVESDLLTNPKIAETSEFHKAYQKALSSSTELSVDDMASSIEALVSHAIPGNKGKFDYKRQMTIEKKTIEEVRSEFVADYAGLLALSMSSKDSLKEMQGLHTFSASETQTFQASLVKDLAKSFSAIADFLNVKYNKQEGQIINGSPWDSGDTTLVIGAVRDVHDNLVKMLETTKDAESAKMVFQALTDRLQTSVWDDAPVVSAKQVEKMLKALGMPDDSVKHADLPEDFVRTAVDTIAGVRPSWWTKLFPMTQMARFFAEVPLYKTVIDTVQTLPSLASNAAMQMTQYFSNAEGQFDSARLEKLGIMKNQIAKAFSWIELAQSIDDKHFTRAEMKTELEAKYPGMSEADIDTIYLSSQQGQQVAQAAARLNVQGIRDSFGNAIAVMMQRDMRSRNPTDLDRMGAKLANLALERNEMYTRGEGAVFETEMQNLVAEVVGPRTDPEGTELWNRMVKYAFSVAPKLDESIKQMMEKKHYSSEVRSRTWIIAGKKADGTRFLTQASTAAEAAAIKDKYRLENAQKVKVYNKEDQAERWKGQDRGIVQAAIAADQALYNSMIEKLRTEGADEATLELVAKEFKPGDGALGTWTPPHLQKREYVAGREDLNMAEQLLQYVGAVSYGNARKLTRQKASLILGHESLYVDNPAMGNSAREFMTQMLDSRGGEFTKTKNFIFLNTLAFNISSNLVNMPQNFMVGAPILIKYGATAGDAFKGMMSASNELRKAHMKGKSFKTPVFENPEHAELMNRLAHDKIVDSGVSSELFAEGDSLEASHRSMAVGNGNTVKALALAENSMYHLMKYARNSYGFSEQFNQRAAGIAGWEYATKKLGLSGDAAYNWAKDFVKESNFGGGAYNRPAIMNGLGKGFGAGGLIYSMQGYTFNVMSIYAQLARDTMRGYKAGNGLKTQSAKALVTMLGGQALMGGMMGLPMVGAMTTILEKLFPDLEVKKHIREAFMTLVGDDEKLGHMFADMGQAGIFNAVSNADVGSRFQLSSMLGVDSYAGFKYENLAGPLGSITKNYKDAFSSAVTGDLPNAAEKILPSGLRNLSRMITEEGGFRTPQGAKIIDPTGAEQAVAALGFRPKRLAQTLERDALIARSEEINGRRMSSQYAKLADMMEQGNMGAVKNGLYNIAKQEKEAGNLFDPRVGLSQVVDLVVKRKEPREPRRAASTNAKEVGDIVRQYPQTQARSEGDVYMMRKALERGVGIPGAGVPSPTGMRMAQMVDKLIEQNPRMTKDEAKAVVERALKPRLGSQLEP